MAQFVGLAGVLLLGSACGSPDGVSARPTPTVSCPSDEQINDMESDELNRIPKECDENVPHPADKPGVIVGHWEDVDGDSTLDSVKTLRTPPFVVNGTLATTDDQDWIGVQWTGGTLHVQITGPADRMWAVITNRQGEPVAGLDREPSRDLRVALPQGTYYVVVAKREDASDSRLDYRISASRAPST
jgi:hypothetical protein